MYRLRVALGMLPEPSGQPSFIWLERWDSFIIGACIGVGVPLLGLSGFDSLTKWIIAAIWFAFWPHFFWYFEGRELIGQMQGRGSIEPEQVSRQQNTSQDPFYGVVIAVFVWLIVLAVHATLDRTPGATISQLLSGIAVSVWRGLWVSPVHYGIVEWLILIHAWIVTKYANYMLYNIGNTLLKSTPMGERVERRIRPAP
jgi:hypothetical protein